LRLTRSAFFPGGLKPGRNQQKQHGEKSELQFSQNAYNNLKWMEHCLRLALTMI